MIKFVMASALKCSAPLDYSLVKICFVGVRECRFTAFRTQNFSKEKREKKKAGRPSGGSQKSKFFKKNTTR